MEKELVELFEKAKKAADAASADGGADSSPEESRCLDALKRLKKLPINYDILVSTQVGKRLRQLTKHPRKSIQSMASDVVEMWKGIIVKETAKNRKNGNVEHEGSVKAEPGGADSGERTKVGRVNSIKLEGSVKAEPTGADSVSDKRFQRVSSVKVEKASTASSVKVERVDRSFSSTSEKAMKLETSSTEVKVEEDGKVSSGERMNVERITIEEKPNSDMRNTAPKLTSLLYTKDQVRDKMREIVAEALCKVTTEVDEDLREEVDACDPYRVATMVESAMFEKWGRSTGAHKAKYRSICFNIKDPNNPDFRRKVLLGQFPPNSIVYLSAEDMASDARQKQNEKIKEKALFECGRENSAKASTNAFKCGRCGKRETTYYQLQTRSADEPMTTFVTCVNCNNHWKFC
ncbi:unnamed protein product [Coffea canephora]|uniref:Transcription elongation factor TFIIS-like n=2 Tax=Coffea TaxID=13442 RepID=A0A068V1X1_COFCA|nr:transcription elongation factor TFIIS-like [Coffea arabica]CDP13893.1 unnamed protein product [Coffea canephora]